MYNYSDSGFDIRWATQTKQIDGSYLYESKRETVDPLAKLMNNARSKLKEAYYIKGKGLVAIDGSLIRKKLAQRKETTEAEKDEIQYDRYASNNFLQTLNYNYYFFNFL